MIPPADGLDARWTMAVGKILDEAGTIMCFSGGGPEATCVNEPSYPLSMVPLGVFRRRECSAWSCACACNRLKLVVMRCKAGACWAPRTPKERGVELVFWGDCDGCER